MGLCWKHIDERRRPRHAVTWLTNLGEFGACHGQVRALGGLPHRKNISESWLLECRLSPLTHPHLALAAKDSIPPLPTIILGNVDGSFRPKEDVHRSAQCRTAASLDRSLVQRATFL
jgi:hypothetical protein